MSDFVCPVCRKPLERLEHVYRCCGGHSYDISKTGYVNLLISQKSSAKQHGDDKLMVHARSEFLDRGYYSKLRETVAALVSECSPENAHLLDSGCGECYYTSAVAGKVKNPAMVCGIDISKDALSAGAKRLRAAGCGFELGVASIYDIPAADESFDVVMNIFSPMSQTEYLRILKPGGFLIYVIPLRRHLFGLKAAIYEHPYENKPDDFIISGFETSKSVEINEEITLENKRDIQNLFTMTPYYYKTGEADRRKHLQLEKLTTEISFCVTVYRKPL